MKRFLGLSLVTLFISTNVNAGIMLDPFLSYGLSGDSKTTVTALSQEFTTDYKSLTRFGLRVGYTLPLGLAIGIDYQAGTAKADKVSPTNALVTAEDADTTDIGLFASYDFPILLRGYATYYFNAKAEMGTNELEGTGIKFGAQYTGLPFVAIGAEYVTSTYDDLASAGLTDSKVTYMALTVSVPLSI
jgi:hypothetical protein